MEAVKIWLVCILASIIYGILHDQITAHICIEYFSIAHPIILPLTTPTALAFEWGIVATWWVGCILGIVFVASARLGRRPRIPALALIQPIIKLLVAMATSALLAGIIGFLLAKACNFFEWLVSNSSSASKACSLYG